MSITENSLAMNQCDVAKHFGPSTLTPNNCQIGQCLPGHILLVNDPEFCLLASSFDPKYLGFIGMYVVHFKGLTDV